MRNTFIRDVARAHGVRLWEIADRLGMNDGNFSRKLRHDLPSEEEERILSIIRDIHAEHEKEAENA